MPPSRLSTLTIIHYNTYNTREGRRASFGLALIFGFASHNMVNEAPCIRTPIKAEENTLNAINMVAECKFAVISHSVGSLLTYGFQGGKKTWISL